MNLITWQAEDFFSGQFIDGFGNHKTVIGELRNELYEYRKIAHKINFLQDIMRLTKVAYDEHYEKCQDKENCQQNIFYQNVLFFMQNELDGLQEDLPREDFSIPEQLQANTQLGVMLEELQKIQLGQQFTYDDLMKEVQELRELYFLNKKNWMQLFTGKITEMVAGGVISETVSKNIVELIRSHLPK